MIRHTSAVCLMTVLLSCFSTQIWAQNTTVGGRCVYHKFTCGSGECIERFYVCDGSPNCDDGSDEQNCDKHKCRPYEFNCGGGHCTLLAWACDGKAECKNGEDEMNCSERTCNDRWFSCGGGHCIPPHWVCDGTEHCNDSSDERNCQQRKCDALYFTCGDGSCIPRGEICDGKEQCEDGLDEKDCTSDKVCESYEFTCGDGQCIHQYNVCNGRRECKNNEDERNCDKRTCPPFVFSCGGGQCVPKHTVCDGALDCVNGVDEQNCDVINNATDKAGDMFNSEEDKGSCRLPGPLSQGKYRTHLNFCPPGDKSDACRLISGTPVPEQWVIYYDCFEGYKLSQNRKASICLNSEWKPSIPTCVPTFDRLEVTTDYGPLATKIKDTNILEIEDLFCILPNPLVHGDYFTDKKDCSSEENGDSCRLVSGTPVPDQWTLHYSCHKGYKLSHDWRSSVCLNRQWHPHIPICVPTCSSSANEVDAVIRQKPTLDDLHGAKSHYHGNR